MSPVEGFLCSGTQAGEFAPIELILLYSIYSLHLACLYIWRILVGQDSCILLLNTPGILLVSFYAAEFQILYSWAAHNENFILLLTAETKRDAWCWPWGLSGWHSAEDSPQNNFGWDPQMQMQVQLNLASGVAWQSGSSSWGTAVCSPKSQFIAEAVTAGKELAGCSPCWNRFCAGCWASWATSSPVLRTGTSSPCPDPNHIQGLLHQEPPCSSVDTSVLNAKNEALITVYFTGLDNIWGR